MKKWTSHSGYTPLMLNTESKIKLRDLNPGTVVDSVGERVGNMERVIVLGQPNYVGWIDVAKAEPYYETLPKNCVDMAAVQTPDTRDAEQYAVLKGKINRNLCGPIAIAQTLSTPLMDVLAKWEPSDPTLWKMIFNQGVARGTSDGELTRLYRALGYKAETLNHPRYTPALVDSLRGAIVSTHINTATGRLNGGGVLHWVVIESTQQERSGYGTVNIYNPFPNRVEIYSYTEFIASARTPYGTRRIVV